MNLQQELRKVEAVRAELLGRLANATTDDRITALEEAQPKAVPGSKAHEALLASGYGFDKAGAVQIIKERDADPRVWPFEKYQQAKAFLEALKAKPQVISTRKPWRIRAHSRVVRQV